MVRVRFLWLNCVCIYYGRQVAKNEMAKIKENRLKRNESAKQYYRQFNQYTNNNNNNNKQLSIKD